MTQIHKRTESIENKKKQPVKTLIKCAFILVINKLKNYIQIMRFKYHKNM